jgi:hypothetical protein
MAPNNDNKITCYLFLRSILAQRITTAPPLQWKHWLALKWYHLCMPITTLLLTPFVSMMMQASTRAMCKWSNTDYMLNNNTKEVPTVPITKGPNAGKMQPRPDRGRLPRTVPEPKFVADPNHRRKVLTGELIALANSKVAEKATMTRMDSTRIGKSYGYMIRRQLKNMQETDYIRAGKAVLEHHFNNHE